MQAGLEFSGCPTQPEPILGSRAVFMPKSIEVATIILAGGQGTRLHPLTIHHSKPAVSYGGRYRLIDIPISNSINSDFRQIFVIAQYLSGELQHHISQTYHFDHFNPGSIDVLTPQENEKGEKSFFSGTADAVRKNLPTILKSSADYFLILSGDQLYNINFQSMVAFAQSKQADLTIASLPVHEKEAHRMGLLKIDAENRVVDFVEKPNDNAIFEKFRLDASFFERSKIAPRNEPYYLGSMGIYVFKRKALVTLLQQDERSDFGYHLIDTSVKKGKRQPSSTTAIGKTSAPWHRISRQTSCSPMQEPGWTPMTNSTRSTPAPHSSQAQKSNRP